MPNQIKRKQTLVNYKLKVAYNQPSITALKPGKLTNNTVDLAQQINIANEDKPEDKSDDKEFLCCVNCHNPITHQTHGIYINESHQHTFANPHGIIYQIACFAQAPGCVAISQPENYFSWFPGYTWQVAVCEQCFNLLGWVFCSSTNKFFGLISNKLILSNI